MANIRSKIENIRGRLSEILSMANRGKWQTSKHYWDALKNEKVTCNVNGNFAIAYSEKKIRIPKVQLHQEYRYRRSSFKRRTGQIEA